MSRYGRAGARARPAATFRPTGRLLGGSRLRSGPPHDAEAAAMSLSRRTLLKSSAAAGALLMAKPLGALAQPLAPGNLFGTSRASRLFPESRTRLVHADLHNHTLLSDG